MASTYRQKFRLLDEHLTPYQLRRREITGMAFYYRKKQDNGDQTQQFTRIEQLTIDEVDDSFWVSLPPETLEWYMVLQVEPLRTIQTALQTTTFSIDMAVVETFATPCPLESLQGHSPYISPQDLYWYQYDDELNCYVCTYIKGSGIIDPSQPIDHPIVDYIQEGVMSAVTSNAVANLRREVINNVSETNIRLSALEDKRINVRLNGENHLEDDNATIDLGTITADSYKTDLTMIQQETTLPNGTIVPRGTVVDKDMEVFSLSSPHQFANQWYSSGKYWIMCALNGNCQLNIRLNVYNNSFGGTVFVSRNAYDYVAVTTSDALAGRIKVMQRGLSAFLVVQGSTNVNVSSHIEVVDGNCQLDRYPSEVDDYTISRSILRELDVFLTSYDERAEYITIDTNTYETSFADMEIHNYNLDVSGDVRFSFTDNVDAPTVLKFTALHDDTVVSVMDADGNWVAVSDTLQQGDVAILTWSTPDSYSWSYSTKKEYEITANKVNQITSGNSGSTYLYPSLKALTQYVEDNKMSGYVSSIKEFSVGSSNRSSLSLYNAYIRRPRLDWYKDGNTAFADRDGTTLACNIISPMDASSWANIKKTLGCELEGGNNVNDWSVPSLSLLKQCVDHLDGGGLTNAVTSNTITNIENPSDGLGLNANGANLFCYDNVNLSPDGLMGYWWLSFGKNGGQADIRLTMDYDTKQGFFLQGEHYYPIEKIKINGLVKEYDSDLKGFDLGNVGGGGGGLDSVTINGSAHTVSNNSVDLGTIKVQTGQDIFSADTNNLINIGQFSRPSNCKLRTTGAGWVKFSGNNSWFDVTVRNYEGTVRVVSYENNGGIRVLYTESGNRLNVFTTTYNSQDFYLYYGGNCNYYIKVNQGMLKITDNTGTEQVIHAYDEESQHQYVAQLETGITESQLFLIRGYGNEMNYGSGSTFTVTNEIDYHGTLTFSNNADATVYLAYGPKLYVNDLQRNVILKNTSTTDKIKFTILDARNSYNVIKVIEVHPNSQVRTRIEWIGSQTIANAYWRTDTNVIQSTQSYWNATSRSQKDYRLLKFAEDTEVILECLGRQVRLNSHNGELFLLNESELQDTMWIYFSDSNGLTSSCLVYFDYLLNIKVLRGSVTVNEGHSKEAVLTPYSMINDLELYSYSTSNLNLWQLVSGYGDDSATLAQHKKYHRSGGSLSSINVYMSVPACTRQTIHIVETLYTTASPSSWTAFLFGKDKNGNNYQISRQHSFETTYGKEVSYPLKWDVKLQKWVFDEQ